MRKWQLLTGQEKYKIVRRPGCGLITPAVWYPFVCRWVLAHCSSGVREDGLVSSSPVRRADKDLVAIIYSDYCVVFVVVCCNVYL